MPKFDMSRPQAPQFDMARPERPAMPERPQFAQAKAGGCMEAPARPVALEMPQMKEKAEQARASFEAQQAERQAAMQARMDEMKKTMEDRRAQMQAGACKQI
jgi:hypothetical protein